MSKGKPLDNCKTCSSEIVESVNDRVFREGECDACEYLRYKSQPELLDAVDYPLEQTLDRTLAVGNELDEHERDARERALSAIAKANGPAA